MQLYGAQYIKLFTKLVISHCNAIQNNKRAKRNWRDFTWCAFWPMIGVKYRFSESRIMIVGRALNGWDETEFSCNSVSNREGIDCLVRKCNESFVSSGKCKLEWVGEKWGKGVKYRTSRSQFWQMVKRIVNKFGYREKDWYRTLVWSNLMRISPSKANNPPSWSYNAQISTVTELIKYEMHILKPELVIFLTGKDWFEGLQVHSDAFALKPVKENKTGKNYVHYVGEYRESKIIVSEHPQRKPQDIMISQIFSEIQY